MSDRNRGGRIPPDGRTPQPRGVGANARRHDLERPATPGLHDSDLQQGDVQALEQGQRIAPRQTQQRGQAPRGQSSGQNQANNRISPGQRAAGVDIPDAIQFLGARQGTAFDVPETGHEIDNSKALTWLPILRRLAAGPGSSGMLASAIIDQARNLRRRGQSAAAVIDVSGVDDAIETMTREV